MEKVRSLFVLYFVGICLHGYFCLYMVTEFVGEECVCVSERADLSALGVWGEKLVCRCDFVLVTCVGKVSACV